VCSYWLLADADFPGREPRANEAADRESDEEGSVLRVARREVDDGDDYEHHGSGEEDQGEGTDAERRLGLGHRRTLTAAAATPQLAKCLDELAQHFERLVSVQRRCARLRSCDKQPSPRFVQWGNLAPATAHQNGQYAWRIGRAAPGGTEMEAFQGVVPMIAYADAPTAIDWLARAFGFVERDRITATDGTVSHAELDTGHGIVMLATPTPAYEGPKQHQENCEQARKWFSVP
jgi:hypothetical protein